MPSVALHYRPQSHLNSTAISGALPQLLQTPSGLAILEIQGTINAPTPASSGEQPPLSNIPSATENSTLVGRLVFPLFKANVLASENTAWMKRVYLYVGKHQRLTGEVKTLPKPIAIIRKREPGDISSGAIQRDNVTQHGDEEQMEIVEIVKYKILFASRPEPVGD